MPIVLIGRHESFFSSGPQLYKVSATNGIMRCPNCQLNLPHGYRYCLQCGEDLGDPTLVQRPETVTRVAATPLPVARPQLLADDETSNRILSETSQVRTTAGPVLFSAIGGAGVGICVALILLLLVVGGYSVFTYLSGNGSRQRDALPAATPTPRTYALRPELTPEPQTPRRTAATPQSSLPRAYVMPEPPQESLPAPTPTVMPLMAETIHVDAGSYSVTRFEVNKEKMSVVGAFSASSPVEFFVADVAYEPDLRGNRQFPTIWFSGRVTDVPQIQVPLGPGHYMVGFNNRFSVVTSKNIRARVGLAY